MTSMPHRLLGPTGLQVSILSYGFWATFGVKQGLSGDEGIERAKACLSTARAAGINLFDNAEVYGSPRGAAETVMGEAIAQLTAQDPDAWRRSDYLITTKIFWGGDGVNESGLSRKHVREGVTAACKRLQADYVDLVFCHRPDPWTPTQTVVRAMSDVVRSGQATAWGTSEWSAQQITEAWWIAQSLGLEPPCFEQPQYNMFHRERFEQEYFPLYREPYKLGTTTWSPLMSGILTGKYNDEVPEGSRLTQPGYEWLQRMLTKHHADGTIDKVRALTSFAERELDCSMTKLALAWAIKNPNVTTVLLGATKVSQLEENLGAVEVARQLTDDHMSEIETLLGNKPEAWSGYGGAGMRSFNTI